MKTLNALYYPEIVCLDEGVLKSLLLMYDKIYFLPNDIRLNPGHTSISSRFSVNDSLLLSAFGSRNETANSFMYASEKKSWDEKINNLMGLYDFLEDEKICIPLQDETFESPTDKHPLFNAVKSDIADNNFVNICEKYKNERYFCPKSENSGNIKGGGFVMRPSIYKKGMGFFALCSERINSALYFAGFQNLVPVSTKDLFLKLYGLKLKRATNNPAFIKEKNIESQNQKIKFGILSWEVFTEIVPQELLLKKNAKQILKYKEETTELQKKFRNYLSNLELMINSEPWSDTFKKEIDKLVRLNVVPEFEGLKEKKKVIWEKLFNEVIKTTFSKTRLISLFSIHLIPNLSYLELILYSTAVFTEGILPKIIDLRQEEKEINRNALFFLLNFK